MKVTDMYRDTSTEGQRLRVTDVHRDIYEHMGSKLKGKAYLERPKTPILFMSQQD